MSKHSCVLAPQKMQKCVCVSVCDKERGKKVCEGQVNATCSCKYKVYASAFSPNMQFTMQMQFEINNRFLTTLIHTDYVDFFLFSCSLTPEQTG